jgi:hypothetical protein
MKVYKTIEHDKYRVTVEQTDNGKYRVCFWDKHWVKPDERDYDVFNTIAEAYERALDMVAEENLLKIYNHSLD